MTQGTGDSRPGVVIVTGPIRPVARKVDDKRGALTGAILYMGMGLASRVVHENSKRTRGESAIERRRRQIAAGSLRVENGLLRA